MPNSTESTNYGKVKAVAFGTSVYLALSITIEILLYFMVGESMYQSVTRYFPLAIGISSSMFIGGLVAGRIYKTTTSLSGSFIGLISMAIARIANYSIVLASSYVVAPPILDLYLHLFKYPEAALAFTGLEAMGLGLSALGGWIGFKIKRRQVLPAPRVGVPQPTIRSPEPIPSGIPEAFERKKNFLTDDEVVKVVDVEKVYRRGPTEVYVLNGINMNAKRGEFVVIVGPSGSGKTTLLNIISTLDRPTRGRSYLDGEDTTLMMEDQRAMIRRKKIGFIFQSYNLINVLTALENVELSMFISGLKEDRKKRALGLLNSVGLSDRANHRPDELSGGEQQRVAIARALANKPSLIIADEPTANLDTRNEDEILKILYDLSKSEEVTVILATHNPFISRFADKVIELKKR